MKILTVSEEHMSPFIFRWMGIFEVIDESLHRLVREIQQALDKSVFTCACCYSNHNGQQKWREFVYAVSILCVCVWVCVYVLESDICLVCTVWRFRLHTVRRMSMLLLLFCFIRIFCNEHVWVPSQLGWSGKWPPRRGEALFVYWCLQRLQR